MLSYAFRFSKSCEGATNFKAFEAGGWLLQLNQFLKDVACGWACSCRKYEYMKMNISLSSIVCKSILIILLPGDVEHQLNQQTWKCSEILLLLAKGINVPYIVSSCVIQKRPQQIQQMEVIHGDTNTWQHWRWKFKVYNGVWVYLYIYVYLFVVSIWYI